MKNTSLDIDCTTFPGVALLACQADTGTMHRAMESVSIASFEAHEVCAASLNSGNLIAMKEQDWRRFYDAWYRVREFEKIMDDAAKILEDMTSSVEG